MMLFAAGSYTNARGRGISIYEMDETSESCRLISEYQDIKNPSYLSWDASLRKLYAISEMDENTGAVAVFDLDEKGFLRFSGQQEGPGRAGCHLTVLHKPDRLFAVSYSDGRLSGYELEKGEIGSLVLNHFFEGSGPVAHRQASSHAHQVLPDMMGHFLYVSDLGSDIIWMHNLEIIENSPIVALKTPPGYGPRHLTFDSDGKHAYILCELIPRLLVVSINPNDGNMTILQELDTVKSEKMDIAAPAAVKLHPSGRTLAVSNRFDDTITVFSIHRNDASAGNTGTVKLSFADRFPSLGKTPRDISYSPDGNRLLIANQDSHNISCRIFDAETGLPREDWGVEIQIGSPVCIVML